MGQWHVVDWITRFGTSTRTMKARAIVLLAGGLACGAAAADDYYEQMAHLKALDQRCEQARAVKLAPIREQYIKDCLEDRHKILQDCQFEASQIGESVRGPRGGLVRGQYYDLPECQEAAQAWKKWEESRPGIR